MLRDQLQSASFKPGISDANFDPCYYYPETVSPRFLLRKGVGLYPQSDSFKVNLKWLLTKYVTWRRVRGDGNCYYRAVGCNFFEHLVRQSTDFTEFNKFIENLESMEHYFHNANAYLGDDYNIYCNQIRFLRNFIERSDGTEFEQLERLLVDATFDISTVKLMRLLTANFLWVNYEHPKICDYVDQAKEELVNNVFQMGHEAEGLALFALPNVLGCMISIESTANDYDYRFDEYAPWGVGSFFRMALWFRPGHYDTIGTAIQAFADGFDINTRTYSRVHFNEIQRKNLREQLYYEVKAPDVNLELTVNLALFASNAVTCFIRNVNKLEHTEALREAYAGLLQQLQSLRLVDQPALAQILAMIADPINLKILHKLCNFADCSAEALITLGCSHMFCGPHLDAYCSSRTQGFYLTITEFGEERLICPIDSTQPIEDENLEVLLGSERFSQSMHIRRTRYFEEVGRRHPGKRMCCVCNQINATGIFITDCQHTCLDCMIIQLRQDDMPDCSHCGQETNEECLEIYRDHKQKCQGCGIFRKAISEFSREVCPKCNKVPCVECAHKPMCMKCGVDYTSEHAARIVQTLPVLCQMCGVKVLYYEQVSCRCFCYECINSLKPVSCRACKVPYTDLMIRGAAKAYRPSNNINCTICGEKHFVNEILTLLCDHRFGEVCLTDYVKFVLQDFGDAKRQAMVGKDGIKCPQHGCDVCLDTHILANLIPQDLGKFLILQLKNEGQDFLECPKCNGGFDINGLDVVNCPHCNYQFCTHCGEARHRGNCRENYIQMRIAEMEKIGGTVSQCPRCRTPYMKDEKCEHVKCINPGCEVDFCFLCSCIRSPTLAHGNHYHRQSCRFWSAPGTEADVVKGGCSECVRLGQLCLTPPVLKRQGRFSEGEY
jgi:hypothetical protein